MLARVKSMRHVLQTQTGSKKGSKSNPSVAAAGGDNFYSLLHSLPYKRVTALTREQSIFRWKYTQYFKSLCSIDTVFLCERVCC